MAEATEYDKLQDQRLDDLESLITAEYEPPEGTEYSFPVANQGITQEQFRSMFLGQANGMIHGNNGVINDSPDSTGWRYYLDRHDSDSETNQRNTLILRAGTSAESIVEGFYHRLTEDIELPFPPVTTKTTYYVTITYDPRDFRTNPVKIQVYPGTPPTSHDRVHVVLYKVERGPNQLLTQATVTRYRPYTAGLLSVQNRYQLPDPAAYPAGTLVVPSAEGHGVYVRQNAGLKWLDVLGYLSEKPGPWKDMLLSNNALDWSGTAKYRRVSRGIEIYLNLIARTSPDGYNMVLFPASSGIEFTDTWYAPLMGTGGDVGAAYHASGTSGNRHHLAKSSSRYCRVSTVIPDYVLSGI